MGAPQPDNDYDVRTDHAPVRRRSRPSAVADAHSRPGAAHFWRRGSRALTRWAIVSPLRRSVGIWRCVGGRDASDSAACCSSTTDFSTRWSAARWSGSRAERCAAGGIGVRDGADVSRQARARDRGRQSANQRHARARAGRIRAGLRRAGRAGPSGARIGGRPGADDPVFSRVFQSARDMDGFARIDLFKSAFTSDKPVTYIPSYGR